jgi:hypothetical protein
VFLELELRVKCRVACFTPGRPLAQAGSFNVKATEGSVAENNPAIGAGSILERFGGHAVRSDVLVRVAVRVEGLEADLAGKSIALNLKSKCNYKKGEKYLIFLVLCHGCIINLNPDFKLTGVSRQSSSNTFSSGSEISEVPSSNESGGILHRDNFEI